MRQIFLATLLLGTALFAKAQSGTNSPYSQYGLGVLSDQTSGFNRGMNGVGLGFHEHNQVNYLNPASYAALDSTTFIFDAGISGQVTNFDGMTSEGNRRKINANNANFEYAVAGFRLVRHVGMSFGVIPFTNVGYSYTYSPNASEKLDKYDATYANTYSGEGGIHQVYVGAAWTPFQGFSFGANVSYLWGDYTRAVSNDYSDSYVKTLSRTYTGHVTSYKFDFGVQYTHKITKNDWLTLGLTYSPGHNIGSTNVINSSTSSQTSQVFADTLSLENGLKLPHMMGAGLMWNHAGQWKVGLDYTLQKWGSLGYPSFESSKYYLKDGVYKDRHKVNLGVQYCYGERNRSFLKRVNYRAGVSYATPYCQVNGVDGPKELSVSAGFGIPIVNSYNNRSQLNISGQWVKSSAKDLIKENTFRINIGFTFNEDWFKKWKMQ